MRDIELFFDLDGTVLDVSARHHRVYARVCSAFGGSPLSKEEYWRLKQQKLPWPQMLARSGVRADLLDDFMSMFIAEIEKPDELDKDQLIAGAKNTLMGLHENGHTMYLVSLRRNHQKFLGQLANLGIASYFAKTLSGHTEGSTDALKAQLIREHLSSHKGLIVGDTEADVLAGKQLGMVTVAVKSGIRSAEHLQKLKPDYLVDDVTSLPLIIGSLPQD